ncbi:MAG: aminotransferase class I/II-fold pyridoxal phosphate-dependent enzyme [Alphaproteobacteria bacterium]|nr:aminotransferase class I/II-fold pyridoxal phosphate-dependent enzyme [Alphaproteobacteria bacterium]
MLPVNLYSDNVAPAAPEIMAALARVDVGPAQPYGQDPESKALKAALSDLFGTEVWVFPVSTGTAANAIGLSAMTPPFGAIYCSETAHIETSECGAAELFTGGAKLQLVRARSGKMDVDALDEAIRKAGKGLAHRAQPATVNLTIATERGTVYPLKDLERIAEVTKRHGLRFHMDGARMANALAALGASAADVTTRIGVDVLSFGATKNGALNAEAIVAFRKDIAEELRYRVRRAGQVWSKMRYASAQLRAYVEGGLWLRLATQANAAGKRLSQGLVQVPDVRMLEPVEINQLFVEMPERVIAGLESDGIGLGRRDGGVRMVTAWCSTNAEIDHVVARAKVHGARAAA